MNLFSTSLTQRASNGAKRFFDWSHSPIQTLGGAAFIIAVAGLLSRFLGFIRDRLLASTFGAGDTLDIYYAAFRLPDLIYGLLVLGALSAAFVPVFTELISTDKKNEAWQLTRDALSLLLFTLGITALLGIFFAPFIAQFLAPGFSPDKQQSVASLTRIMLLSPLLLGLSAVFGGVLVSLKQFLAYSFAPILYNIGIIVGITAFYPWIGESGLAWGVVLGAFLHMLVQYPGLYRFGFRFVWPSTLPWRHEPIRRVIRLMVPRSLAMAVNQVSLLLVTIFATTLASGSLAAFTLASNIQSVPLGLFGISFALAAFPVLSILAAEKKDDELFRTLTRTTRRILFFVVPLSILMIIFRAEIVRVILGAGEFSWEDTILTFQIFGLLSISLFAQSLTPLFVRAFFALQDTRRPFYAAIISQTIHILLIPLLLPRFDALGLAIAFSIGVFVNLLLLYFFLRPRIVSWQDETFIIPAVKILLIATLAGLVAQLSKGVFALAIDRLDTFIEVFFKLFLGGSIGTAVYLSLAYWLRFPELDQLRHFIKKKILRQPETALLAEDHPERGDW